MPASCVQRLVFQRSRSSHPSRQCVQHQKAPDVRGGAGTDYLLTGTSHLVLVG